MQNLLHGNAAGNAAGDDSSDELDRSRVYNMLDALSNVVATLANAFSRLLFFLVLYPFDNEGFLFL